MPFYKDLNPTTKEGKRTLEKLLELRKRLATKIPPRTLDNTLLLATWNIRDFDKPTFGWRLEESYYYIAEIISHFDIVAIQEVYKELSALEKVSQILGGHWKKLFTDETMGEKGNDERMAFLYDSRKLSFEGLASELVLPGVKDEKGNLQPVTQVARTPFMVGFRAGWMQFVLATVHILWDENKADPPQRIREIREVARFLKQRTVDKSTWSKNIILLGDFNIFGTEDATFQEILKAGFTIPEALLKFRSNATQTRHYDQIALIERPQHVELTGNAGVFNYYDVVFRDTPEDKALYMEYMKEYEKTKGGKPRSENSKKNYYQSYWRTHQMSDHLPMWVEMKIDFSDAYLKNKLG
jgi:endonuclease/exonuclease/phosphatase family metal-dependent hydrolase